jgi:hypothetical protein
MFNTNGLVRPKIHDNGTPAQTLKNDLEAVWDALEVALNRFNRCAPNARDYNGPEHYDQATDQYLDRCATIRLVQHSIEREMDAIDDQCR